MSHFLCGFKTDAGGTESYDRLFSGIVPEAVRSDRFQIADRSSLLVLYGTKKAIGHITVRDETTGSWLVMAGTPLLPRRTAAEDQDLLHRLLRDPARVLSSEMDGNFALFAYDASADWLLCATDYNNTTPVFFTRTLGGVLFSSHELPLARQVRPEVDLFGFCQAIQLGVTWGSRTRFQGISKMLPCQLAICNAGGVIRTERYWRPQEQTPWSGSFDDQRQQWGALLQDAVRKFYDAGEHRPVIADFTAGEDARLILAQCHALGIPFTAQVTGADGDLDVIVGKRAAEQAGFGIIVREKLGIGTEQLLADAMMIAVASDAYLEFFKACSEYATDAAFPTDDYGMVKYCGVPGGEAFRGSYYLRGKAFFPSRQTRLDRRFFTKMKYLLDYRRGLLRCSDDDLLADIDNMVRENLEDVADHPLGIQIDHLLRVFQTCFAGLKYRNPLYLPLATNGMTRSIYGLSPRYKQGGGITKACTELLFPELAVVKTQNGVPTVKRTFARLPLFLPEHFMTMRKIASGTVTRLLKWRQANKWYYSLDYNAQVFTALLNSRPYSSWFASSRDMLTGAWYESDAVDPLLAQAKTGSCRYVPLLGRIINNELAFRWVAGDTVS